MGAKWKKITGKTVTILLISWILAAISLQDGEAGMLFEQPAQGLDIQLNLDRSSSFQDESVFFTIILSHSFATAVNVTSFLPTNRSLSIILYGEDGSTHQADQLTGCERDGINTAEPRTLEGVSLEPGKKLELHGDLLSWFGPLPAGKYSAHVEYQGILRCAKSPPVALEIMPVLIQSSSLASCGQQPRNTPFVAAWTHRIGHKELLFFQLQSYFLARNPIHCAQTVLVADAINVKAACVSQPDPSFGYVYWQDREQNLFVARADFEGRKSGKFARISIPFPGSPVGSPLTLKNGNLLVPFADYKKKRFVMMKISQGHVSELNACALEDLIPIGAYVGFWESDRKFHFAWSSPGSRKIKYTVFSLSGEQEDKVVPKSYKAPKKIIRLDAYLDKTQPAELLRALYLEEKGNGKAELHKPELLLWTVTEKNDALQCSVLNPKEGTWRKKIVIAAENAGKLEIIQSVVTSEHELVLLLQDSGGKLYYGSTTRKTILPLEKITRREITLQDFPQLTKSGDEATEPWVHLRYVADGRFIKYIRLEPQDEMDPVEQMINIK